MEKLPVRILLIGTIIYLVASFINNQQIITNTLAYKDKYESYANALNYKNRLLDFEEWFDAETRWPAKKAETDTLKDQAYAAYNTAVNYSWIFVLITLLYAGFVFWMGNKKTHQRAIFAAGITAIALACLHVGLFAPMLEIAAFEQDLEVPVKIDQGFLFKLDFTASFEGPIYFYYQSKSVIELIVLLLEQNNFIVGISILAFSVLIPAAKIITSVLLLWKPQLSAKAVTNFFVSKTSKWSMADVFVVAMFLSYLAFSNMETGIQSDSKVRLGLYFFFAYVIFGIFIGIIHTAKEKEPVA